MRRAWLAILKDTTLLRLVNLAVRENRDVGTAVARIREFRAEVGVARSGLFPELTANGSVSTNQAVFGAFEPQQFDAFRVTADVQWELDSGDASAGGCRPRAPIWRARRRSTGRRCSRW